MTSPSDRALDALPTKHRPVDLLWRISGRAERRAWVRYDVPILLVEVDGGSLCRTISWSFNGLRLNRQVAGDPGQLVAVRLPASSSPAWSMRIVDHEAGHTSLTHVGAERDFVSALADALRSEMIEASRKRRSRSR